jgi:hypothetical protein
MNLDTPSRNFRPYFWLLFVAVLGFIFVPSSIGGDLARRSFQIGWPLPTMVLEIGAISRANPTGLHTELSLPSVAVALANIGLWLVVLFGLQLAVEKFRVPDRALYLGVVITFCLSLAVCISGGASFLAAMVFG